MSDIIVSQVVHPVPVREEVDADAADLLSFDDVELEQALKAVSWNVRDVAHFLRNVRATGARASL
jgi:hypothetical protein